MEQTRYVETDSKWKEVSAWYKSVGFFGVADDIMYNPTSLLKKLKRPDELLRIIKSYANVKG